MGRVSPPVDLQACAQTLIARMQSRQDAERQRSAMLREQAHAAARALAAELAVRRTWLFGSLAWGTPHGGSDVDLLVEGLEPGLMASAERRVAGMIAAPVDLVRREEAPEGLVERVEREGLLL